MGKVDKENEPDENEKEGSDGDQVATVKHEKGVGNEKRDKGQEEV